MVVPDCLLLIADSGGARRDGLASVGRQLGFWVWEFRAISGNSLSFSSACLLLGGVFGGNHCLPMWPPFGSWFGWVGRSSMELSWLSDALLVKRTRWSTARPEMGLHMGINGCSWVALLIRVYCHFKWCMWLECGFVFPACFAVESGINKIHQYACW